MVGLGSMVGAGVFVAFAPAAESAGSLLWLALLLAAAVAYCNASSSARLAARYPESGGTYVYGRERLGPFWGYLAGWAFTAGKLASCAAMALTVGAYLWPEAMRPVAVAVVAGVTALNYVGIHRSAAAAQAIVSLVLVVLGAVVLSAWSAPDADAAVAPAGDGPGWRGVLQAAGFLFFAFAGYARIATLGEEVRDPGRTIPRAIALALGLAVAVYAAVGSAVVHALGIDALAAASAPLVEAVHAGGEDWLVPLVRIGAALAALGSLLALVPASRAPCWRWRATYLPRALDRVHPVHRVPRRAELAVGAVVSAAVIAGDLRPAIGFSAVCVLAYYAIANASAWTLGRAPARRFVPAAGLIGCVAVGASLPPTSVLAGAGVLAAGTALWVVRRRPTSGHRA